MIQLRYNMLKSYRKNIFDETDRIDCLFRFFKEWNIVLKKNFWWSIIIIERIFYLQLLQYNNTWRVGGDSKQQLSNRELFKNFSKVMTRVLKISMKKKRLDLRESQKWEILTETDSIINCMIACVDLLYTY